MSNQVGALAVCGKDRRKTPVVTFVQKKTRQKMALVSLVKSIEIGANIIKPNTLAVTWNTTVWNLSNVN